MNRIHSLKTLIKKYETMHTLCLEDQMSLIKKMLDDPLMVSDGIQQIKTLATLFGQDATSADRIITLLEMFQPTSPELIQLYKEILLQPSLSLYAIKSIRLYGADLLKQGKADEVITLIKAFKECQFPTVWIF